MPILTVGLLSDTHIPYRLKQIPDAVLDALAGVDLILHAGDVDDPLVVLEQLENIAQVHAVRGNIHLQDFSDGGVALPSTIELQLAEHHIVLVHGHRPGPMGFLLKGLDIMAQQLKLTDNGHFNQRIAHRLTQSYPTADIIVFGHTHQAYVQWIGHTLLVNPGAICPTRGEQQTVARLQLGQGKPDVEIIPVGPFYPKNTYME
ncbi:MAG: metallophosphoesterase family protein [Chloroflexi bacterium]|nr:metallophosphoesterase family protein [Chloroflexota bacterium]